MDDSTTFLVRSLFLYWNTICRKNQNGGICSFVYHFAVTRALYIIGIYPLTEIGGNKIQSKMPIIAQIASMIRLQSKKLQNLQEQQVPHINFLQGDFLTGPSQKSSKCRR